MRSLPVLAALLGLGLAPAVLALAQQPEAPPPAPAPAQPAPAPAPAPAQPAPAQPAPAPAQPAAAQPTPAQPAPAPAQAPKAQPAAGAPAAGAPAQPPKPGKITSVCPGKILPLAVGNTWTYESVQARDSKGLPVLPPENMKKLLPLPATKIVLTVTGAETANGETTVKLNETVTYDITKDPKTPKLFNQKVESTIVCSAKGKFEISPSSFLFAGEPGGYRGIEFKKFDRKKDTTLKLTNNSIGENEWFEEIVAEYQKVATPGSNAKLGGGKLEMERKLTPQAPEGVATRVTTYKTSEKIGITTSGRIYLDTKVAPDGKPCIKKVEEKIEPKPGDPKAAPPKPGEKKAEETRIVDVPVEVCELPPDWIAQIWLVESVGLVQALNPYAHMYQLVEAKLN